ncbi:hypothetical protein ACFOWX_08885 [Sphingorhabdus arenilitoris]|uniref:Tetratricopeptide repeat protein n=1 Tax=Sphingorhabdus arenilitoris TaxID=1490041 RepID=A0ABV8RJK5_9SPHN
MIRYLTLTALILTAPAPLFAQTQSGGEPQTSAAVETDGAPAVPEISMRDILAMDLKNNVIPQYKRADLSTCDAAGGHQLYHAFRTCWPVQEPLLAYQTIKDKMRFMMRSGPPPAQPDALLAEILAEADKIINLSKDRTYPGQDISLTLAHTMRGAMAEKSGDYKTAIESLETIAAVMESSKVTIPDFNASSQVLKKRDRLLDKQEQAQQSN